MFERTTRSNRFFSSLLMLVSFLVLLAVQGPAWCNALHYYETEIRCPMPWQVTYPEKVITFDLKVSNPASSYDSFVLYIDNPPLPEGWKAAFYFQNNRVRAVEIEAKQAVTLILLVEIPEDAFPGDYDFNVYANGTYSIAFRTLIVTIEELPIVPLEISCPVDWQVTYPENYLTFNLHVKNLTPYYDNYLLSVGNPPLPINWTVNFYIGDDKVKSFGAAPEETVDLVLEIGVPEGAMPKDYQLRVQIAGNYASATQGLTITVEEIPLVPRKVSLICPFQSRSVLTGQSTYYPIKVTNEGPKTEEIFLELERTTEMMIWDISFSSSRLTLDSEEFEWVVLNVKPPNIVEKGNYTVKVRGSTEDGLVNTTLQITTNILAEYLMEIVEVQPVNPEVATGEKIDIAVTVRNVGQSPLTRLKLEVTSTAISNIFTTPVDVLALEPMSSITYYVSITPDNSLTAGNYLIEVQAVSSETQSSVRAFVVSVVSSIPWFWISICITIIATALAVFVIERLISKHKISLRLRK
jgi:uncharacterized membrane protein